MEACHGRTVIPSSGLPTILPSVMSTMTEAAASSAPDPTPNDIRFAFRPSTAPAANPPNTPFQASFFPAQDPMYSSEPLNSTQLATSSS